MTKQEFIDKHGHHNWAAHYDLEKDLTELIRQERKKVAEELFAAFGNFCKAINNQQK